MNFVLEVAAFFFLFISNLDTENHTTVLQKHVERTADQLLFQADDLHWSSFLLPFIH